MITAKNINFHNTQEKQLILITANNNFQNTQENKPKKATHFDYSKKYKFPKHPQKTTHFDNSKKRIISISIYKKKSFQKLSKAQFILNN